MPQVRSIDRLIILHALNKDCIEITQKIFLQLLILFQGHLPEPVRDVFIMQNLPQISAKGPERLDDFLLCRDLFLFLFPLVLLRLQL